MDEDAAGLHGSAADIADPSVPGPRIYAQMRPTPASAEHLRELQEALPRSRGLRRVSAERLHLTLIHFGKVHEVRAAVGRAVPDLQDEAFLPAVHGYLAETRAALPGRSFTLEPAGPAGFGPGGRVLVVEYRPTAELLRVHARLYAVLEAFLQRCGVADPAAFAAQDPNFRHASTLRPHITLARGWCGQAPVLPALEQVTVEPMPVLYR